MFFYIVLQFPRFIPFSNLIWSKGFLHISILLCRLDLFCNTCKMITHNPTMIDREREKGREREREREKESMKTDWIMWCSASCTSCFARHSSLIRLIRNVFSPCRTLTEQVTCNPRFYCVYFLPFFLVKKLNLDKCYIYKI